MRRASRDPVQAIPASSTARGYFAVQALVGVVWWVAVFASHDVRRWTLGGWRPGLVVGPDLVLFVGASALAALRGHRAWALVAAVWTTGVTVALLGYALLTREAGWGGLSMAVATMGTLAAAATLWFGHLPTERFFVGPFAFRVAGEQTRVGYLRRSLGQLVVFWAGLLILVPVLLAGLERRLGLTWGALHYPGRVWVGAAVFLLASGVGVWACFAMAWRGEGTPLPAATARRLVVAGPYRFVRNPMALTGGLQAIGAGLWLGSWLVLAVALVGAVVWDTVIRPVEEADLAARFGADYQAYRSRVRRWVPTVGRSVVTAREAAPARPAP